MVMAQHSLKLPPDPMRICCRITCRRTWKPRAAVRCSFKAPQ